MYSGNDIGAGQAEQVIVAFEVGAMVGEALPAVILFLQAFSLDHGSHSAIQYQYALM